MASDIFHFPWEEIIFIAFSEATRYYDFILYIQQNLILPSGFSCKILLLAMVHWTVTMKASSWNISLPYLLLEEEPSNEADGSNVTKCNVK